MPRIRNPVQHTGKSRKAEAGGYRYHPAGGLCLGSTLRISGAGVVEAGVQRRLTPAPREGGGTEAGRRPAGRVEAGGAVSAERLAAGCA